jgi:hypothetical protein
LSVSSSLNVLPDEVVLSDLERFQEYFKRQKLRWKSKEPRDWLTALGRCIESVTKALDKSIVIDKNHQQPSGWHIGLAVYAPTESISAGHFYPLTSIKNERNNKGAHPNYGSATDRDDLRHYTGKIGQLIFGINTGPNLSVAKLLKGTTFIDKFFSVIESEKEEWWSQTLWNIVEPKLSDHDEDNGEITRVVSELERAFSGHWRRDPRLLVKWDIKRALTSKCVKLTKENVRELLKNCAQIFLDHFEPLHSSYDLQKWVQDIKSHEEQTVPHDLEVLRLRVEEDEDGFLFVERVDYISKDAARRISEETEDCLDKRTFRLDQRREFCDILEIIQRDPELLSALPRRGSGRWTRVVLQLELPSHLIHESSSLSEFDINDLETLEEAFRTIVVRPIDNEYEESTSLIDSLIDPRLSETNTSWTNEVFDSPKSLNKFISKQNLFALFSGHNVSQRCIGEICPLVRTYRWYSLSVHLHTSDCHDDFLNEVFGHEQERSIDHLFDALSIERQKPIKMTILWQDKDYMPFDLETPSY